MGWSHRIAGVASAGSPSPCAATALAPCRRIHGPRFGAGPKVEYRWGHGKEGGPGPRGFMHERGERGPGRARDPAALVKRTSRT